MALTPWRRKIPSSEVIKKIGSVLLLVYITFFFISRIDTSREAARTQGSHPDNEELVFFLILCEGEPTNSQGGKIASNIDRQIRQASVMLKSAAALTSKVLKFIIISDSEHLYKRLTNISVTWPLRYQYLIKFHYKPVWYPEDREHMRSMFRVCATERLFLPDMFPDLDAGIYVDTDLIFLRPPEDLWNEFEKFDDRQLAAMAPCLYHYDTRRNKVPHYGKTGLNAGIMHMNLTRIKTFPGGWTKANMKVFDQHKKNIKLADQDILNILFHKFPEYIYELGCEWNYRIWQCSQGYNMCPSASHKGISLLHGNALAFVNGNEMKLQMVFEAWENHILGTPLSDLLQNLQNNLQRVTKEGLTSKCARIPGIDKMLTKQLEMHTLKPPYNTNTGS